MMDEIIEWIKESWTEADAPTRLLTVIATLFVAPVGIALVLFAWILSFELVRLILT